MVKLILSFPETKQIGENVGKEIGAESYEIIVKKFPDGETFVKLPHDPKGKDVILIHSLSKEPNSKMMEASLAAQTARDYGAKSVMLVATYLPYMRQDIHFNPLESRSAMFLKEFFRQFDKVLAIDPHLHRIRTLKEISSKAKEISAKALIAEFVRENFAEDFQIVGPDSESKQWGAEIAHSLGKDAIILRKQRFSSFNVHVRDHDLGKKVLIIDDIISTGRTLLQTIRIARRHGAKKIYCIGIHGILLADSAELIGKYAEIITTNSVPNKFAKIDVSPIISAELKKIKK